MTWTEKAGALGALAMVTCVACSGEERCRTPIVIDGAFTELDRGCTEWAVEPMTGVYGDLYIDLTDEGSLVALNDWHLRDDAPIPPDWYNLFLLDTDQGQLEVRVYGNQTIAVWQNGEPWGGAARGAAGFGVSPTDPNPHTIFEFELGLSVRTLMAKEADPGGGPASSPEDALVEEPTAFHVDFVEGTRRTERLREPFLTTELEPEPEPDPGPVPEPDPICEPSCNARACGDDGCGGSCGSCGPDTYCDDATGTCAPESSG